MQVLLSAPFYTWNNRLGDENIRKYLEQCLASNKHQMHIYYSYCYQYFPGNPSQLWLTCYTHLMDKVGTTAIWSLEIIESSQYYFCQEMSMQQRTTKPFSGANKWHCEWNYLELLAYKRWLVYWPQLPRAVIINWINVFWEALLCGLGLGTELNKLPFNLSTIEKQVLRNQRYSLKSGVQSTSKPSKLWSWDIMKGTGGHAQRCKRTSCALRQVCINLVQDLNVEFRIQVLILNAGPGLSLAFVLVCPSLEVLEAFPLKFQDLKCFLFRLRFT